MPDGAYTLPEHGSIIDTPGNTALWLFEDISRAWTTWKNNYPQARPAEANSITLLWQQGINTSAWCSSPCYFDGGMNGIFMPDSAVDQVDVVTHEVGHRFMHAVKGSFTGSSCRDESHSLPQRTNPECAWEEGWADFFGVFVNQGVCFDFVSSDCGGDYWLSYNLEEQGFTDFWDQVGRSYVGDQVEMRVAGALWDIVDAHQEGLDSSQSGFSQLEHHLYNNAYQERNLNEFYYQWSQGNARHNTVRTFYQNTIDYDLTPYFQPWLPTVAGFRGHKLDRILDLWDYGKDYESEYFRLRFSVTDSSNPACQFSVSYNRYLNIELETNAPSWCSARVYVSDTIKSHGQY